MGSVMYDTNVLGSSILQYPNLSVRNKGNYASFYLKLGTLTLQRRINIITIGLWLFIVLKYVNNLSHTGQDIIIPIVARKTKIIFL